MTRAQREALADGGLDQQCLDCHPMMVCPHCGACRQCASGCGCDRTLDGMIFIAVSPAAPGTPIHAHAKAARKAAQRGLAADAAFPGDVYVFAARRRYRSGAKLYADAESGVGGARFVGMARDLAGGAE